MSRTFDITIRYRSAIMVRDRWWDQELNRFFNIGSLKDIEERHKWLEMRSILQERPADKEEQ